MPQSPTAPSSHRRRPWFTFVARVWVVGAAALVGGVFACSLPSATDDSGAYAVVSRGDLHAIGAPCPIDGRYHLEADVDLSASDWAPIGWPATPFTGVLDGRGHAITDLTIVSEVVSGTTTENVVSAVGLFYALDGATVRSLEVRDVRISDTESTAGVMGAVAGRVLGTQTTTLSGVDVRNVTAEGHLDVGGLVGRVDGPLDVRGGSVHDARLRVGDDHVGGLIGYSVADLSVTEVRVSGVDARADVDYAGGLVGNAFDGTVTILGTTVSGLVESGDDTVGGFLGMFGDDDGTGTDDLRILGATVDATVSASNREAGGLVGEATGKIVDVGNVTLKGIVFAENEEAGGAFGDLEASERADLRTVTLTADVSGGGDVGGLVGRGANTLFVRSTRLEGDVTGTKNDVGGIVGLFRDGTFVEVTGTVFAGMQVTGDGSVGGILGDVEAATVSLVDVRTEAPLTVRGTTVSDTGKAVGGLVGFAPEGEEVSDTEFRIRDVDVDVVVEGWKEVGGLVGLAASNVAQHEVRDVVVRGRVVGTIDVGTNAEVGGLFGEADGLTTIMDVTVHADVASEGEDRVGGLVGIAQGVDATNVRVTGSIQGGEDDVGGVLGATPGTGSGTAVTLTDVRVEGAVSGRRDVGGIVGDVGVPIDLTRVSVTGDVTGTEDDVGGLVGVAREDVRVDEAAVSGAIEGSSDVGGLVGRVDGTNNTIGLRDAVVLGSVTATGGGAGGVAAALSASDATFERVLVAGSVSGSASSTGGLVGDANATTVTATEVFWNTTASPDLSASLAGTGTVAGTARTVSEAAAQAYGTYASAGWSIANGRPRVEGPANATWTACSGAFPTLAWLAPASCLPASSPVAGLAVGGFDGAQLRNVPFDVTVSLVDAEGERAFATTASTVALSASGGAVDGDLLRYVGDAAVAPQVTVAPGDTAVAVEDVFYTGQSGPDGGDVVLVVSGVDGDVANLRTSTTDLSVRDVEMRVDVSPTTVLVDGVDTATVTVDLLDADGAPVAGEPITLTTDLGGFVRAAGVPVARRVIDTDADGRVQATLSPDGRVGVATVTARCPGACPTQVEVTFTGEVDDLRVVPGNGEAWLYFAPLGAGVTTVAYELDASGTWVEADPPRTRGPIRIDGLENGRSYAVRVKGLTASGALPATDPVTFTPAPVARPEVAWSAGPVGTTDVADGATRVTTTFTVTNEGTAPLPEVWVTAPIEGTWLLDDVQIDGPDDAPSVLVAEEATRWRLYFREAPLAPGGTVDVTLTLRESEVE